MVAPILVAAYAAKTHDLAPVWSSFYPAARAFAEGLAFCNGDGIARWALKHAPHTRIDWNGRVCDCIAALSPQVAWDYNMTLATRAVQLFAAGDTELRGLSGQTKANIRNAASALNGTGPGNGPKVNAFARNIRGDWEVVTVDRHMLEAAGYDPKVVNRKTRADVARRVTLAARTIGEAPATTQALIWGHHRYTKGYLTYY